MGVSEDEEKEEEEVGVDARGRADFGCRRGRREGIRR